MRKQFLSSFIIITFLLYSLHERNLGLNQVIAFGFADPSPASKPITPSSDPFPTPQPSLSPTPTPSPASPSSPASPAPVLAKPQPTKTPATRPSAPRPSSTPVLAKPQPTQAPAQNPPGQYKDGQFVGRVADAFYGNVQVKAIIQGGRIADVEFLDYPHDRSTSVQINTQATSYLRTEAIQAQNANVNVVSGATATSHAFIESLGSALAQAH